MPQYELDAVGPDRVTDLRRGRTPEGAVRTALGVGDDVAVEVGPAEGAEGWRAVRVDGVASGRIRPHQRMRFRRD